MITSVSVIIPVYNGGEAFSRCLGSLSAASVKPLEIIVVDDNSEDGSAQIAQKFGAKVLKFDERRGPASARNAGAKIAQGDLLFFIDADVLAQPDLIGQATAVFRADPELSAMFGSYDDAPDAPNFLSQYRNLFHHYVHQTSQAEASTFWSGCGAIKRDVFLSLGGFDEKAFHRPAIEDIELGYRLKKAGGRIRLERSLQVKHMKRWSAITLIKTDLFSRALPWAELILKEGGFINDLNLKRSNRVSVALTHLLVVALPMLFWQPYPALITILAASLLLLILNWHLYYFFMRKKGMIFCSAVLPWHWVYFFYNGLAFAFAVVKLFYLTVSRHRLEVKNGFW